MHLIELIVRRARTTDTPTEPTQAISRQFFFSSVFFCVLVRVTKGREMKLHTWMEGKLGAKTA